MASFKELKAAAMEAVENGLSVWFSLEVVSAEYAGVITSNQALRLYSILGV